MTRLDIKRAFALVTEYENIKFVHDLTREVHSNEWHSQDRRLRALREQLIEMGVTL
jgi:GTP cyclohydrolase FolE2